MIGEIEILCPHCGQPDAIRETDSDKLSWTINGDKILKELWLCNHCEKYYFIYYQYLKTVPMVEKGVE